MLPPQNMLDRTRNRYDEPRFNEEDNQPVQRVFGNRQALPWRVLRFEQNVGRSSGRWFEFAIGILFACWLTLGLAGAVVSKNPVATRIFLLPLPIIGLYLYFVVIDLAKLNNPELRGRVTLEADRLICDNGFGRRLQEILYEQILDVDLDNESKRVVVKYYPFDRANNLNTSRVNSMPLPKTDNDEGLRYELRQRSFGQPTTLRAKTYQVFAWMQGIVRILFGFGILLLYAFLIGIVIR